MPNRDPISAISPSRFSRTRLGRRPVAVLLAALLLLTACTPPELPGISRFRYDVSGRLAVRDLPAGGKASYSYDDLGRLTRVTYTAPGQLSAILGRQVLGFNYDAAGNLTTVTAPAGNTALRYDADARPVEIVDPNGQALHYRYDPWGQVSEVALGEFSTRYEYGIMGQLRGVSSGDMHVRYQHGDEGTRTVLRRQVGDLTSVFASTASGNVDSISHLDAKGQLICGYSYTYDAMDRVTAVEERSTADSATTRYEYDVAGRLRKVIAADGSDVAYEYDVMGNRVTETSTAGVTRYTYDGEGRLLSAGSTTFSYDRAGNLVSRSDSESGRTTTYVYDPENRLIEVHTPDVKVRNVYDAAGNRVRREVNGKPTQYVVDSLMPVPQVVAELGASGTSQYLFGASRLAKRLPSGKAVFFLEDRLGSTGCVVDKQGRLLTRYSYTTFGSPHVIEGTSQTDFLFAGEQWEADTGLIYLRNRFYDPGIGRFLSVDPVRGSPWEPASFNQYVYVNNDPVNQVDPMGLQAWQCSPGSYICASSTSSLRELHTGRSSNQLFPQVSTPTYSTFVLPPSWINPTTYYASYSRPAGIGPTPQYQSTHNPSSWQAILSAGRIFQPTTGQQEYGRAIVDVITTIAPGHYGIVGGIGNGLAVLDGMNHLSRGEYSRAVGTFAAILFSGNPAVLAAQVFAAVPDDVYLAGARGFSMTEARILKGQAGGVLGTAARFDPAANQVFLAATALGSVFNDASVASRNLLTKTSAVQVLASTFRQALPGSGLLPMFGQRDDRRNPFMPPPPGGGGGGGGGFPKVGGVWLDQSLQILGNLGTVTGADFDPVTGRLTLIGDRSASLPPIKPEYLAAALRAVNLPSDQEPGMTIDPLPGNPRGPVMLVRFFGNTDNTRLGWVMFEADRLMKGYSVGADNVSKQPVESQVPEYRSVTDMRFTDAGRGPDLWSRFWLVPDSVTARVSADGRTITLDPVQLRVKTETMRWQRGRLVPVGGIEDYHAEVFADWLTRHYDEVAAEQPAFAELKLVTQAVALAKWLKAQGAPVDWNLIDTVLGAPYPTPTQTPSAFFGKTQTERDGRTIRSFSVTSIGGVEMKPTVAATRDASVDRLQASLREATRSAEAKGEPLRSVTVDGREHSVAAVPLVAPRAVGSLGLAENDLALALHMPEAVSLPGLTRYYDSTHNERGEFGFSWTLRLPRLAIEDLRDEGGIHYLSLPSAKESKVRVQRFTLTNTHGVGEERFVEHFVDPGLNRIGFAPATDHSRFRGIYPEGGNTYRLVFTNDDQAIFDLAGRLRALLFSDAKALYDYDSAGHLTTIRYLKGKNEERVSFAYDAKGRVESVTARGGNVVYSYDDTGNLLGVKSPAGTIEYRYDSRHLLSETLIDGRPETRNTYDAMGRLTAQEDGTGRRIGQEVQRTTMGHSVTLRDEEHWLRRDYDADLRLRSMTDASGATGRLDYGNDGRLTLAEFASPSGVRDKAEISPDRRSLKLSDGRGHTTDYRLSENGLVEEVVRDGQRVASFRHDDASRVTEVDYGDAGRERLAYDTEGRVVRLSRSTGPAAANMDRIDIAYDVEGRLARISTPSGEKQEWKWASDGVTVTRNGTSVQVWTDPESRPLRMRQPDGAVWRFEYDAEGRRRQISVVRDKLVATTRFQEGRMVYVADPYGGEFKYAYDTAGRVSAATDPTGTTAYYEYDVEHRLRLVKLPDGRCVSYVHDKASGRVTEERIGRCVN